MVSGGDRALEGGMEEGTDCWRGVELLGRAVAAGLHDPIRPFIPMAA